jgi:hypothetical protein
MLAHTHTHTHTHFVVFSRRKFDIGEFIPIPTSEEPKPTPPTKCDETGWSIKSQRTGLLMKKLGMTHTYDEWGTKRAMTALKVSDKRVATLASTRSSGCCAMSIAIC